MAQRDESVVDYVEIGLQLLRLAARLAPTLATWLRELIEGRSDPISTRVSEILPEESRSRAAQRELEG